MHVRQLCLFISVSNIHYIASVSKRPIEWQFAMAYIEGILPTWQKGPFWQDTIDMWWSAKFYEFVVDAQYKLSDIQWLTWDRKNGKYIKWIISEPSDDFNKI